MLCSRCRTSIFSRTSSTSAARLLTLSRSYSSTPSFLSSAPAPNNPSITLPTNGSGSGSGSSPSKPGPARSSCLVGTQLRGLNYTKNDPQLVALDDSEYPDWLWRLLDDGGKGKGKKGDGAEEIQMNRKQRKRHEKKVAAAEAAKPRKIPVHEQAIDITPASETANAGDNLVDVSVKGQQKRGELTKSARQARRKGIRESNFLKGL